MTSIALATFILVFSFGNNYLGWTDPQGHVRLALFTCFVLGIVCGYKTRG